MHSEYHLREISVKIVKCDPLKNLKTKNSRAAFK